MEKFKASEVCELTGIVPVTLDKWIRDGIVSPSGGGRPGVLRYFTLPQVLGLHYAKVWSVQGGQGDLLRYVVGFFASMSETKLQREFDAGRVYVVFDPIGRAKLIATRDQDGELRHWVVNAKRQLEKIKERARAI